MKKVKAFYNNHSEWIWACPVCNNGKEYDGTFIPVANKAVEGELGVCSHCYPDILGGTMVEIRTGVFVPGIDLAVKQKAVEQATKDKKVYEIIFPKFKENLMKELRKRPRRNMNWIPHETLVDIQQENIDHGIE